MNRIAPTLLIALLLLLAVGTASAAPPPAHEYAVTWHQVLSHAARLTLLHPQLRLWIDGLFWTLAFTSLMHVSFNWIRDRADFMDYFYGILFVMTVRVGMLAYDGITSSMFGASKAIGGLYATAMLGYQAEPWVELLDVLAHVQLPAISLWDATVADVIGIFFMMIVTGLLAVGAWVAAVYNEWQYFILKVVGLIFIPFLLFRITRVYFMNWLGLFLSVCAFNLVLGIIAPALLLAVKIGFGFEHAAPISNQGVIVLQLDSPIASLAAPAFILVGILFLFRAGSIAQALAGSGSALSPDHKSIIRAVATAGK